MDTQTRSRRIAEGAFAVAALVAGAALYVIAPDFVRGWAFNVPGTTDVALEPAFFPRFAAVLTGIAAVAVLVTLPLRSGPLPVSEATWRNFANVALGLVGIFIYLASLRILGFVTSSSLFIIVATWVGGYRRPLIVLASAILVSLALRFVFRFGLHVSLPTGFLL